MGFHGAAALVPQNQGQAGGLLENFAKGGAFFRAGAQGAVHILGVAQHQTLHAVLCNEFLNLCDYLLLPAGVDDGGVAGKSFQTVGDGDAGVGVAIVHGHDLHR